MDALAAGWLATRVKQDDAPVASTGARATGWRLQWRRFALWFNPTLIQHALWPVIALLSGFGLRPDATADWAAWIGNIVCMLFALVLALRTIRTHQITIAADPAPGPVAQNTRLLLLGLPWMLFGVRLLTQDAAGVVRVAIAGLIGAIAWQLINMWIGSYVFNRVWVVIPLFAAAWAIHQIAWSVAGTTDNSVILQALGGLTVGVLVAIATLGLNRWPGGRYTAASTQWLILTMFLSFTSWSR
ncbi:MAG TPA: hypothetical protein PK691_07520 [Thermomicrobiales bacterium]|nr:hypothetical protein [Thermomicrobiales bacterium]